MKSSAFEHFTMTYLPTIGLFLFLAVFIMACIWVYRSGSKDFYRELSELPFQKEEK